MAPDLLDSIRRNWGDEAARRYATYLSAPPPDAPRPPGRYWVANTQYQTRRFGASEVSEIRRLLASGATYQEAADQFGCCKATIHYVATGTGAYKNWAKEW